MAVRIGPARVRPLWLQAPTRGTALRRSAAAAALFLAAVLVLSSLRAPDAPAPPSAPIGADGSGPTDLLLYGAVVDGVRAGGDYYQVAADEQRASGFPLHPFVTMRVPTLATVEAAAPNGVAIVMLRLLVLATIAAWWARLRAVVTGRAALAIGMLLVIAGEMVFVRADLVLLHEIWAGLLLSLSLALWQPGRWATPAALALCAALIRETAILYAGVMLVAALVDGRRREVLGWTAVVAVFGGAVLLHAHAVALVTRPDDATSPGWAGLLGFGFFVRTLASLTPLAALPLLLAGPLVALALIGWAGWRDPAAARGAATVGGYAALLSLCARADTYYWGLLVAPILPLGLLAAPDTIRGLLTAALDRRRITVTRLSR